MTDIKYTNTNRNRIFETHIRFRFVFVNFISVVWEIATATAGSEREYQFFFQSRT